MNYFKAEPNLLISSCLLQKAPKPATRIFILSCAPPLISFAPLSRFGHSAVAPLKKQITKVICFFSKTGNVLFSQAVARQVSSALESLTSVFEMGTGGSSPPLSPDILARLFYAILCQLFFPHSLHTPVCASLVSRASSSDLKNPSQFLLFSLFNTNNEKSFILSHFFDYLLLVKFSID